jgi:hypothetical protein
VRGFIHALLAVFLQQWLIASGCLIAQGRQQMPKFTERGNRNQRSIYDIFQTGWIEHPGGQCTRCLVWQSDVDAFTEAIPMPAVSTKRLTK